ncbi:General stress protein 14 [Serratia ficaria]|uniref:NAD(P)H-dependent oxidoreductase n=1 Tax=Serratia ficaria TaxID=61651 RepID=UPI00217854B3|nr:NAD(P)H-dependent oxidoreductase [Serratia ficaria]CAI2078324.1 General stress protein 14 [Serratia ficaria]CAI2488006.1 General stress protein 14 [Serratia ficaria]
MNVLIVLAHPEKQSFNAHLAAQARQVYRAQGHRVTAIDLYQEDFDPREAAGNYANRKDRDRFDPMQEQRHHWDNRALPAEVQRHIALLRQADRLILQFPFWWFGVPAIIKGWMDRVFVYGGLYDSRHRHENGVMRGKRALLTVTAGAAEQACAPDGRDGDMRLMLWPIMHALHYIGFGILEPFLVYGVRGGLAAGERQAQDRRLAQVVRDYRARLAEERSWPEVPFNRNEDFTAELALRPGAPEYSPFVRHR